MTRRYSAGVRQHAKRDQNQSEIMAAFQKLGSEAVDTTSVGAGFPDLAVPICGHTVLVEVKAEDKGLDPAQLLFLREWRGGPVRLARNVDDVVTIVEEFRGKVRE